MTDIYRTAGLELDLSRFQVRRDGAVVPVQPQVFDVLRYLVENRDRVVSKDELLDTIWSGRYISEATLSSRIKAVRQLIGDTGKTQSLLQTLRNRGFRYVGEVSCETQGGEVPPADAVPGVQGEPPTGIAVLPFDVTHDGAAETHIGAGIAADIIALLARHHWLRVISRGSSFAPGIAAMTPQQAGDALGVGYILSGRVRRTGAQLRIDAELADCATGRLLWSEGYNATGSALFVVQEEIAEQIAASIEGRLGQFERQKIQAKRPEDLDAWDSCHKGFWHLYRFTAEDLAAAKHWFARALALEEGFGRAHGGLAYADLQLAFYGSPAKRAAHLEAALASAQRAVALDPWDAFNRFALAFCFTVWDRPGDAFALYEKAVRLSPQDPHLWTFHHMRSIAHFRLDQHMEAEYYARAAARQQHATYWPFATLCALLGELGRTGEAAAIADRLLGMKPGYNLGFARQDFFFLPAPDFVARYIHGLAAAGIPGG